MLLTSHPSDHSKTSKNLTWRHEARLIVLKQNRRAAKISSISFVVSVLLRSTSSVMNFIQDKDILYATDGAKKSAVPAIQIRRRRPLDAGFLNNAWYLSCWPWKILQYYYILLQYRTPTYCIHLALCSAKISRDAGPTWIRT